MADGALKQIAYMSKIYDSELCNTTHTHPYHTYD